jgi:signal peptidase
MKKSDRAPRSRVVHGLSTALVIVIATVAVLLIALAVSARTDESGITRVAGRPVLTVLSDSMTPTFKAGDLLVERSSADTARLKVGDVITFKTGAGDQLITHRVIAVKQSPADGTTEYRTQGDANNAPDQGTVAAEDVVGVYATHIPFGGYVLDAARSKLGMFLLLFIPLMAFLAPEFAKWWRAAGEQENDAPTHEPQATPVLASSAQGPHGGQKGGETS